MSNIKKSSGYPQGKSAVVPPVPTSRVKSSTTSALIQRELLKNQKFAANDSDEDEDYDAIRPKAPVSRSKPTAAANGYHSSRLQNNNVNSIPRKTSTDNSECIEEVENNSTLKAVVDKSNEKRRQSASESTTTREAAKTNNTTSKLVVAATKKKGSSLAKERWAILRKAIVEKTSSLRESRASGRRFDSFGFVKCVKIAYTSPLNNNYLVDPSSSAQKSSRYGRRLDEDDDDDDDVDIQYSKQGVSRRAKAGSVTTPRRSTDTKEEYQWFSVSVPTVDESASVKVRFTNGNISLKDLVGFNNTGNVCLWPSEEIMTYFCVKNSAIFDNKCVCELGGGMTCLGGLLISQCSQPKEVFLTDGNETSFENLEVICNENEFQCSVECCLLQWNKETNYGDLEDRFDYIICADCLFFDEFREDLCVTIYKLLKNEGTCLIFAPNRQNTFHKFVDMAKLHFECMIVHDYDMEVWEKHLYEKEHNPNYEEDIHYPLLLKLKKRLARVTNDFCKMVL